MPTHRHNADEKWKGAATYHSITPPGASKSITNRIWSYNKPTPGFLPLKDYLSFYASTGLGKDDAGGEWRCFVDDEMVGKQEGDFYGGWITSNIKGKMKGGEYSFAITSQNQLIPQAPGLGDGECKSELYKTIHVVMIMTQMTPRTFST